jgi:hypothetical protein
MNGLAIDTTRSSERANSSPLAAAISINALCLSPDKPKKPSTGWPSGPLASEQGAKRPDNLATWLIIAV